ncbi:MAG: hypothetical protein AAGA95_10930, partial [Pseudomonadota bacterium]
RLPRWGQSHPSSHDWRQHAGQLWVDDSDVEAEYQEQEHKVGAFLQALEKRFSVPEKFSKRAVPGR